MRKEQKKSPWLSPPNAWGGYGIEREGDREGEGVTYAEGLLGGGVLLLVGGLEVLPHGLVDVLSEVVRVESSSAHHKGGSNNGDRNKLHDCERYIAKVFTH